MMLNNLGVYLYTRSAKEAKLVSLCLLDQVWSEVGIGKEVKLVSLSLLRPRGLKRVGEKVQLRSWGLRPSGL